MLKGKNLTKLFRIWVEYGSFTSSRSEAFCKTGVLKNTTKFTGKHTCASFFFKKETPEILFCKKETLANVFSCLWSLWLLVR